MLLIDYVFSIVKPPGSLPTAGVSAWRIILQAIHPATEIQTKPHLAERTHIVTFANQTEIGWPHSELIAAMLCGFGEINFCELRCVTHCLCFRWREAFVPSGLAHLVATAQLPVAPNIPLEQLQ